MLLLSCPRLLVRIRPCVYWTESLLLQSQQTGSQRQCSWVTVISTDVCTQVLERVLKLLAGIKPLRALWFCAEEGGMREEGEGLTLGVGKTFSNDVLYSSQDN